MHLNKEKPKNWTYNADSLEDFIQTVRDRARTSARRWNNSSVTGSRSFTGTGSLTEAADMLTHGWPDGAAQILKGQAEVSAMGGLPDLTPAYEWDIGGEFPDVGAYCAGVPEHMGNPAPFDNSIASVVRMVIPGSVPSNISAQQIMRYGVALMSVVDAIQESGRSVALVWNNTASKNEHTVHTYIPITTAGAPVDISRVAFAFHPSMLRRCWFASVEMHPDLSVMGMGYGRPTERPPREQWEHGTIYPRGPWGFSSDGKLDSVDDAVRALSAEVNEQMLA